MSSISEQAGSKQRPVVRQVQLRSKEQELESLKPLEKLGSIYPVDESIWGASVLELAERVKRLKEEAGVSWLKIYVNSKDCHKDFNNESKDQKGMENNISPILSTSPTKIDHVSENRNSDDGGLQFDSKSESSITTKTSGLSQLLPSSLSSLNKDFRLAAESPTPIKQAQASQTTSTLSVKISGTSSGATSSSPISIPLSGGPQGRRSLIQSIVNSRSSSRLDLSDPFNFQEHPPPSDLYSTELLGDALSSCSLDYSYGESRGIAHAPGFHLSGQSPYYSSKDLLSGKGFLSDELSVYVQLKVFDREGEDVLCCFPCHALLPSFTLMNSGGAGPGEDGSFLSSIIMSFSQRRSGLPGSQYLYPFSQSIRSPPPFQKPAKDHLPGHDIDSYYYDPCIVLLSSFRLYLFSCKEALDQLQNERLLEGVGLSKEAIQVLKYQYHCNFSPSDPDSQLELLEFLDLESDAIKKLNIGPNRQYLDMICHENECHYRLICGDRSLLTNFIDKLTLRLADFDTDHHSPSEGTLARRILNPKTPWILPSFGHIISQWNFLYDEIHHTEDNITESTSYIDFIQSYSICFSFLTFPLFEKLSQADSIYRLPEGVPISTLILTQKIVVCCRDDFFSLDFRKWRAILSSAQSNSVQTRYRLIEGQFLSHLQSIMYTYIPLIKEPEPSSPAFPPFSPSFSQQPTTFMPHHANHRPTASLPKIYILRLLFSKPMLHRPREPTDIPQKGPLYWDLAFFSAVSLEDLIHTLTKLCPSIQARYSSFEEFKRES